MQQNHAVCGELAHYSSEPFICWLEFSSFQAPPVTFKFPFAFLVWAFKIKAALHEDTHTLALPVPGTPSSPGPQQSLIASHPTPLRLPPKLCSISERVVLRMINSSSACAHNTENQLLVPHASQVICLSWYKTTTSAVLQGFGATKSQWRLTTWQ